MASPGQASICFSCGQPLPRQIVDEATEAAPPPAPPLAPAPAPAHAAPVQGPPQAASTVKPPARGGHTAAVADVPQFPLTGAMESPLEPPPNPYGASGATIIGAAGQFAIRAGIEVKVGRDPAACPIVLAEPRVSGVHATLRFDNGQLMVRDEGSNNGTHVGGVRIPAGVYTPVPNGGSLRFGPVEFTAKLE